MANYRMPGPSCSFQPDHYFDEGTLARCLMLPIGSMGSEKSCHTHADQSNSQGRKDEIYLNFLFTQCSRPETGLTEENYVAAAAILKIEINAIKAVADVETSGNAFDKSGRPVILFERHYFHKLTHGKYSKLNPDISNSASGGYGKYSTQYVKFEKAFKLDPVAAMRSTSWGRFQIMGNNFSAAGFTSVKDFVLAMTRAEAEHLRAFINFLQNSKNSNLMLGALRKKNWAIFASAYNGTGYKKNHYDENLAKAYNRYSAAGRNAVAAHP